ncbi:keratin, type II cytoskeletal 8-like [Dunckerocampus dactyliophorus]|uniref:keratin, type II cytoskeletal 8-like n=1 Tax=Dunckerocampus dactyliophorus TaxID=161453 RepID=UPI002405488E|nr:keratin, type II cytoskeletal 8-like [Dunckerocampus dactyliophorus]
MSARSKRSSHGGMRMSSPGFSSMSLGSYTIPKATILANQISPVTVNKRLLTPVKIGIDPIIQAVRTKEKDQMKTLNNRFASFIDKVRHLEQENKMLETKWKLLEGQPPRTSNVEPLLKSYIANLQRQLEVLTNDKLRLEVETAAMHKNVADFKTKYEEELLKKSDTENDFVTLKKNVDAGYLLKVDLLDRVASLNDELTFLKAWNDEEIHELQESLRDTSVVVQMDNSRELDMEEIVADVKAQYEEIASRNREDAEIWYKNKYEQITAEADQYDNELRSTKGEILELKRIIKNLQNEIQSVKGQRMNIDAQIVEVEQRGEAATDDAKDRIRDLELALQKAKQDMADQVREYQELMNVKLGLDIEISTYKKLLEGEEERLGQDTILNIQAVPTMPKQIILQEPRRSNPVLIKTMETQNTK